jgi:hypothetical protein
MMKLIVVFDHIAIAPKNLYLRSDLRQIPIHTSRTRYNALHNLILIEIIVALFVGTGSFLIRYFNGHMK